MIFKDLKHQIDKKVKIFIWPICMLMFFFMGFFFQRYGIYGEKISPYFKQLKRDLKTKTTANDLEDIDIQIPFLNYQILEQKRTEALKTSKLIYNDQYVSASINYKGEKVKIKIRLKGDYIGHLKGDKWSFRIKVDSEKTIMGMKQFSLHHPSQRLYLNEWLYHKIMGSQDIISLRYDFLNVKVNGKVLGIYAIEEHFDKRLIENNKRKESIIVRFDENRMWEEFIQFRPYSARKNSGYGSYYSSDIDAFQTKGIESDDRLKIQYIKAAKLLSEFRTGNKSASEVFDTDRLSKFFALSDILGAEHGARWHNTRFYFNPFTNLLEPISFDGNPNHAYSIISNTSSGYHRYYKNYFEDREFYKKYIKHLSKYSQTSFINNIIDTYKKDLSYLERLLKTEWNEYDFSYDFIINNSNYIKTLLNPKRIVDVNILNIEDDHLNISVGNLQFLPITNLHLKLPDSSKIFLIDEIIINGKDNESPLQYKKLRFQFGNYVDKFNIEKLLLGFNFLGLSEIKYEPLSGIDYSFHDNYLDKTKKFSNYKHFDFIYEDGNTGEIFFKSGKYIINKSIIFPPNKKIHINESTSLDMVMNSNIYSRSPFFIKGTLDNPVKIFSSDSSSSGIFIDRAEKESFFDNVKFFNLGYKVDYYLGTTGSVTFYESPVNIINCYFHNIVSEDALNIVRSTFKINETSFYDNLHDALDVDYCNGEIKNSFFSNSGNDAIDLSGSIINLNKIDIFASSDKGISIGESTYLRGKNIKIVDSKFGVISKDLSDVKIDNIEIKKSKIGCAAFQKKSEFGPSLIKISNGSLYKCEVDYIVENNSTIIFNNEELDQTTINAKYLFYDN